MQGAGKGEQPRSLKQGFLTYDFALTRQENEITILCLASAVIAGDPVAYLIAIDGVFEVFSEYRVWWLLQYTREVPLSRFLWRRIVAFRTYYKVSSTSLMLACLYKLDIFSFVRKHYGAPSNIELVIEYLQ